MGLCCPLQIIKRNAHIPYISISVLLPGHLHSINKRYIKQKRQPRMENPETLATLGTQDTRQRHSRDTGNIWYTRHAAKTIQRHWQHWVHKTRGEDKPETLATLATQDTRRRQSRDTGNIGYTRHPTKTNKTIATTKTTTQKAYKMSNTNPNKHLLLIIYTDRKTESSTC